MSDKVPVLSIVFMSVALLFSIAAPIGMLLWLRKKKNADLMPFFAGCAVMLVFALLLETLVRQLVLGSGAGKVIRDHIWLYALYGGFMAGLVEESGRFIAFKTVLKKYRKKDVNALMYGAGHGGFEAFWLLGLGMINNLIYSALINFGKTEVFTSMVPEEQLAEAEGIFRTLIDTTPALFLLGIAERVFAIVIHLSLSVLVWFAAKKKGKVWLYPLAILLHLLVDGGIVVLARSGAHTLIVEAVTGAAAALLAVLAVFIYRKNTSQNAS